MKCFLLLVVLVCSRIVHIQAFAARSLEDAAIQRFRAFDKLCKTCPTTLKPRVETLTEMIVGLAAEEREELWSKVARRLESSPEVGEVGGAKSPEDVFRFQTGPEAAAPRVPKQERREPPRKEAQPGEGKAPLPRMNENDESKLMRKMMKIRAKLQESKCKRSRIQRLLHQTDSLLSSGTTIALTGCDETDSGVYHSIDEMKAMSPTELKYQRLKYMAQKSKMDQKIAKCRVKLYGVSLELAKAAEQAERGVALMGS